MYVESAHKSLRSHCIVSLSEFFEQLIPSVKILQLSLR